MSGDTRGTFANYSSAAYLLPLLVLQGPGMLGARKLELWSTVLGIALSFLWAPKSQACVTK